ncbi:hypothetical protein LZ31DRAFT_322551 [Colletotrichum somersetense]|nr:hypothetical protein LZ31DRAFT_322551 [Colletotrichum somersetense]
MWRRGGRRGAACGANLSLAKDTTPMRLVGTESHRRGQSPNYFRAVAPGLRLPFSAGARPGRTARRDETGGGDVRQRTRDRQLTQTHDALGWAAADGGSAHPKPSAALPWTQ